MIHTRSGNSKWLNEISHRNPLWLHPADAARLGAATNDLVRVTTEIGYFVLKAWLTEGIRPGIIGCSHHMGRWRLKEQGMERWSSALADLGRVKDGQWAMSQRQGITPWPSDDPDSMRVWWTDAGVHQNLTFPVHPHPVSGMHCWRQKVTVARAEPGDRYGDILVDTNRSAQIYREWLALARPARSPRTAIAGRNDCSDRFGRRWRRLGWGQVRRLSMRDLGSRQMTSRLSSVPER